MAHTLRSADIPWGCLSWQLSRTPSAFWCSTAMEPSCRNSHLETHPFPNYLVHVVSVAVYSSTPGVGRPVMLSCCDSPLHPPSWFNAKHMVFIAIGMSWHFMGNWRWVLNSKVEDVGLQPWQSFATIWSPEEAIEEVRRASKWRETKFGFWIHWFECNENIIFEEEFSMTACYRWVWEEVTVVWVRGKIIKMSRF